MPVEVVLASIC